MKYEVQTILLDGFECGDIIEKCTHCNDNQWALPNAQPGGKAITADVIHRNPDWFKKVKPEIKVGQYWKWDNVIFRVQDKSDMISGWKLKVVCGSLKRGNIIRHSNKNYIANNYNLLSDSQVEQELKKEAGRRGLMNPAACFFWKEGTSASLVTPSLFNNAFMDERGYLAANDPKGTFLYRNGSWPEQIYSSWVVRPTPSGNKRFRVKNKSNGERIWRLKGSLRSGFRKKQAQKVAQTLNRYDAHNPK